MIIYDPKIAILLIAFNRSNIKQVFDRIKVVKPRRLYIAVDESTNDTQCKICKETTSIVSHIDWECQVFKLYQEKNQGYDKHCFHSISWFFEQEPEGIILEDDCVPSLSFFGFCTTLLKKFRNDERIGHISGSNYQFGKNRGDGTYYYSNLTHVSGWAGWRRVWQEHCLNENKYDLFNQLDYLSNLPSHAPFQYRWNRLFNIANHSNEHFWEVKYAYTNLINNRLSIIPNKNLITKIAYYDKMPHAIKNHPFTNIKNEEIDHIVHPSFICPDIEADLYSQTKEYNTSFEELYMPKEYFYLKEHFVAAIRNNHIHPKIPQIIHQIYEDLAGPPPSLVEISQSWKELNPDWKYRFWNKNDIETFLKTYYPEEWEQILGDFKQGADLKRLLRLPFITVRQGNRLRKGIDAFFSSCRLPQYIFECDEQELIYDMARKGSGAGLLSPVVCWKNYHAQRKTGKPFHVFPVINEIPENTVSLVYRKDYPLPEYARDFIRDAGMVFQNYSRSIHRHFG